MTANKSMVLIATMFPLILMTSHAVDLNRQNRPQENDASREPARQNETKGHRTRIGVHNGFHPATARELGVETVRFILKDHQIEEYLKKPDGDFGLKIREFRKNGVELVACIRWPADVKSANQMIEQGGRREDAHPDRIPIGEERENALDLLEKFLTAADGQIDWYQLQNEPLGGPGQYSREELKSGAAFDWLEALAERARRTITSKGLKFRIVSPGLTGKCGIDENAAPEYLHAVDRLIALAGKYCDAFDIHLNVESHADLTRRVAALKARMKQVGVDCPLVALEWSNAHSYRHFARNEPAKAVEMRKFIEAAYARPVSPSAWRSFTDTLPIDKDFLRNSYEHMVKEGFLIACWAGMFQYGQPHFDAVALIANKTVDRQHVPNEPFHSEYKAVAKRIRATGSDLHDPEIK